MLGFLRRLFDYDLIIKFLSRDVWRISSDSLSRRRSFLLRQLRTVILAFRGFDEDKCSLRASALTFYTLLSIVPVVAMGFGVAKGFALEKTLEREILARFKGHEEAVNQVISFANNMLDETRGGLIAGIGVATLLYLIIRLLSNIESSFNEVWGITHSRSLGRKLSDYLSMVLICPVLLVMSSSITVFISTQVTLITQKIALLGAFSPLISLMLNLLPYAVTWLLFTFVYIFIPNTKVHFRSALFAGVVAGSVFQVVQWVYITFQIGAAKYGAIYGSFAALPLFLVWLHVSWMVVLFGAEISFASQNVETYEFEPDSLHTKPAFKKLLALRITQICVKNFHDGLPPWSAEQISHDLGVPIRLVNMILFELTGANILSEVRGADEKETLYQPARDVDTLSLSSVIEALDDLGTEGIPVHESYELETISRNLKDMRDILDNSPANLLLKDI
jgi:membrane protein